MAHYEPAKFWSGRNGHARAFSHWIAGHALLDVSLPFSRLDPLGFILANVRTLPRVRFADERVRTLRLPADEFMSSHQATRAEASAAAGHRLAPTT